MPEKPDLGASAPRGTAGEWRGKAGGIIQARHESDTALRDHQVAGLAGIPGRRPSPAGLGDQPAPRRMAVRDNDNDRGAEAWGGRGSVRRCARDGGPGGFGARGFCPGRRQPEPLPVRPTPRDVAGGSARGRTGKPRVRARRPIPAQPPVARGAETSRPIRPRSASREAMRQGARHRPAGRPCKGWRGARSRRAAPVSREARRVETEARRLQGVSAILFGGDQGAPPTVPSLG